MFARSFNYSPAHLWPKNFREIVTSARVTCEKVRDYAYMYTYTLEMRFRELSSYDARQRQHHASIELKPRQHNYLWIL